MSCEHFCVLVMWSISAESIVMAVVFWLLTLFLIIQGVPKVIVQRFGLIARPVFI